MIIFKRGHMPVNIAATIFGKDASWVREGIREGWLPIGIATGQGMRLNYYISPKKVYEFTGYLWEGEKI